MNRINNQAIEEYHRILNADPNSKVFAALADAYRELGIVDQAMNLAKRGIAKHPTYAPGFVVYGRIFLQKKDPQGALHPLKKAIELAPDNLLAYQLLGEAYLQLKQPKEALKAHKMALFLNPQNERSKQVIQKLESLTADEFEQDVFQMQPLSKSSVTNLNKSLDTGLSVVDALIIRQELLKARNKLLELQRLYPSESEIEKRLHMISGEQDLEAAQAISPLPFREKAIIDSKVKKLQKILRTIQTARENL